jgi:hypothetical protein
MTNSMQPLDETLRLLKRQTQLERAMRQPGGIRVMEERELVLLRSALAEVPTHVATILDTAARKRKPLETMSPEDLERVPLSLFLSH